MAKGMHRLERTWPLSKGKRVCHVAFPLRTCLIPWPTGLALEGREGWLDRGVQGEFRGRRGISWRGGTMEGGPQ